MICIHAHIASVWVECESATPPSRVSPCRSSGLTTRMPMLPLLTFRIRSEMATPTVPELLLRAIGGGGRGCPLAEIITVDERGLRACSSSPRRGGGGGGSLLRATHFHTTMQRPATKMATTAAAPIITTGWPSTAAWAGGATAIGGGVEAGGGLGLGGGFCLGGGVGGGEGGGGDGPASMASASTTGESA